MRKTGNLVSCAICTNPFYAAGWEINHGRKYCSEQCYDTVRANHLAGWNKGRKREWHNSTEFKKGQTSRENNVNWKGGVTLQMIRFTPEYKDWRKSVFERDDFTCLWCKKRGGRLEADHIYPQSLFPNKRLNLDNGRTLCKECHKKTITYLNRKMTAQFFQTITGQFSLLTNQTPVAEDDRNGYQRWDSGSAECEVLEFLFGLVRMIKPKRILETGTFKGWSAAYMATALRENAIGIIDTIEYDPQHYQNEKNLWGTLGVTNQIKLHKMKAEDFQPEGEYDLLFLDSEPSLRWGELERFYPILKPGGYAFLHDLPGHFCTNSINPDHPEIENWPWGPIPNGIITLMKNRELIPFSFMTPRSMTGFYKPRAEDFKI